MAKQVLNNNGTDTHGTQRTKINANFTELYEGTAYPRTPPLAGGMWRDQTGHVVEAPDTRPIIFWTFGESNTGGYVPITKEIAYSLFAPFENMIVDSAAPATQTLMFFTSAAYDLSHNLSFTGTGTITYSGAATGSLVGTGPSNRVNVSITPNGSPDSFDRTFLTLTITGTVTNAMLIRGSLTTYAANSTANTIQWPDAWEIASGRSELRIWDYTGLDFEKLDLGTNNNRLHGGLHPGLCGWERAIAKQARIGNFGSRPVYWVQTGTGGSTVATWQPGHGSGQLQWAKDRFNAAESVVPNATHVCICQIGINDAEAGTAVATYKAGLQTMLTELKAEAVNPIVILPKIPASGGAYNANYSLYNTAIDEIAATDTATYKTVSATGLQLYGSHWTYMGMEEFANRIYSTVKTALSLPAKAAVTWSANQDATNLKFVGAAPQYAYSQSFSPVKGFSIIEERRVEAGNILVAAAVNTTPVPWFDAVVDKYLLGYYYNAGAISILYSNQGVTASYSVALNLSLWIRIVSSGPDILLQISTDGGAAWTTIHTREAVLHGIETAYCKVVTIGADHKTHIWFGDGL